MRGRCLLVKLYIGILRVGPQGTPDVPKAHRPWETGKYIPSNNSVCSLIVPTSRARPSPQQPGVPELPWTRLVCVEEKSTPAPSAGTATAPLKALLEGMPFPNAFLDLVRCPSSQICKHTSCPKTYVPFRPFRSEPNWFPAKSKRLSHSRARPILFWGPHTA